MIFPAFEESAKKAGKDPSKMEKMVEVLLHFADTNEGVNEVRRSGNAGFLARGAFAEADPRRVQEMSATVNDETIKSKFSFASSPEDIIEIIEKYGRCGATHVELVTHSFSEKIKMIGKKVLPYFNEKNDSN